MKRGFNADFCGESAKNGVFTGFYGVISPVFQGEGHVRGKKSRFTSLPVVG